VSTELGLDADHPPFSGRTLNTADLDAQRYRLESFEVPGQLGIDTMIEALPSR
jgi:hypothetical protein